MKLYTLEELPPRLEVARLSPVSSYVLQSAQVNILELLPTQTSTDRSSSDLANRKSKKLDILRSIRRKMLDNEYELRQIKLSARGKHSNEEARSRDPLDCMDEQLKQQRKRSSKYSSKAGKKSSRSVPRNTELRFCGSKKPESQQNVARQKSLKTFQHKRSKKSLETEKEIQVLRLRHSKELIRQI